MAVTARLRTVSDNVDKKTVDKKVVKLARFRKRRFNLKPRTIFLWTCMLVVAFIFGKCFFNLYQVDQKISQLEQNKAKLLDKKEKLLVQKKLVNSNAYIEKMARENLGLVKQGEKLLMVAEPGKVVQLEDYNPDEIYGD